MCVCTGESFTMFWQVVSKLAVVWPASQWKLWSDVRVRSWEGRKDGRMPTEFVTVRPRPSAVCLTTSIHRRPSVRPSVASSLLSPRLMFTMREVLKLKRKGKRAIASQPGRQRASAERRKNIRERTTHPACSTCWCVRRAGRTGLYWGL